MNVRGAIVDVDGTLVRGDEVIPGAREAIVHLRAADLELLFVSNNPTKTPEEYRDRLADLGFELSADEMVTSGTVTAEVLAADHPDDELFVVGERGLIRQLEWAGLSITDDPDRATVVVASIDRRFDYDRLADAYRALQSASAFVGTDPDRTIPAEGGRSVPGSGAIVTAIEGVADRKVDRLLGKPARETLESIERRLSIPFEDCVVVGDRLDTDLALGVRGGATTVLVLTGVIDRDDLSSAEIAPDFVIESIADVDRVLSGSE